MRKSNRVKVLMALGLMVVSVNLMADLAAPVGKVKCTKVPATQAGTPDEAKINAWLKTHERESVTESKSVSVTALGKEFLVCRTFQSFEE